MKTVISIDVEDFFPQVKGNLTKVTWAHAVNSFAELNKTLNTVPIMMIEADVQLGTYNGNSTIVPIMAHPPSNTSDLSLELFLKTINQSNKTKGAKLDFKTIEAFEASLTVIQDSYNGTYPLWINADILPGPINATTIPVNATRFFEGCKNFSSTTLSVGWTTNYGPGSKGSYNKTNVDEMIAEVSKQNTTNRFTFPVRAGLAAESQVELVRLVNSTANSTLTIWSSANDTVNVDNLRDLIFKIGLQKVYIDVPEELLKQLRLDQAAGGGASAVLFSSVALMFAMLVILV